MTVMAFLALGTEDKVRGAGKPGPWHRGCGWAGRSRTLHLALPSLRRSLEGFQPEFRIRMYFTTWQLLRDGSLLETFGLCLPVLAGWLLVRHFTGFFLK